MITFLLNLLIHYINSVSHEALQIQNPFEQIRWSFFAKIVNGWKLLFSQKAPSYQFDWVLNTLLMMHCKLFHTTL